MDLKDEFLKKETHKGSILVFMIAANKTLLKTHLFF